MTFHQGSDNKINDINKIRKQKNKSLKNNVVEPLNINSLRDKFIFARAIIRYFDGILISKSNLNNTFPNNQFKTDFCKMVWHNRNKYGGCLILYINKNNNIKFWLTMPR